MALLQFQYHFRWESEETEGIPRGQRGDPLMWKAV